MKKIILLTLVFISITTFSQEKKNDGYFPAEYVLKKSPNDTIKAKVRNIGIYSNKKYSDMTILFKMTMLDNLGKKTKILPEEIKYIKITDTENNTPHEFFASTDKFLKDEGLVKILYEGKKISWYKDYVNSLLSTSIVVNGYIVDNNKNIIFEGFLDSSKKHLKKLFKQYPDLSEMMRSAKTDEDYINILRMYGMMTDKLKIPQNFCGIC